VNVDWEIYALPAGSFFKREMQDFPRMGYRGTVAGTVRGQSFAVMIDQDKDGLRLFTPERFYGLVGLLASLAISDQALLSEIGAAL